MAFALLITTLASFALLVVGLMGLTGRLPRNHLAGFRTRAISATDETWDAGHRTGSVPMIFGGVAALMAGFAFLPFVLAGEVGAGLAVAVVLAQALVIIVAVLVGWRAAESAARRLDG